MPFLDNATSAVAIPNSNIITSAIEPSNPQIGDTWNELKNDEVFHQWNYLNIGGTSRWASQVYNFMFPETSMSQNQQYPLNTDFDYFIKDFYGHYFASQAMPANGQLIRRLYAGNKSNLIASNIIAAIGFTAKPAGTLDTAINIASILINTEENSNDSLPSSKINALGNYPASSGSFTISVNSYSVMTGFTYQLVRKQ